MITGEEMMYDNDKRVLSAYYKRIPRVRVSTALISAIMPTFP